MTGLILAAFAVGLSNFAAAIAIGVSGVDAKLRWRIGLVFGFFEGVMPIVGLLLGHRLAHDLGSTSSWLGGGLLCATGIYTIIQSRRASPTHSPKTSMTSLIITGAALSIDNLVVGFALGTYHVNLALAAVLIAGISVSLSLLGLELGARLGTRIERYSGEFGGLLLIIVGICLAAGLLS